MKKISKMGEKPVLKLLIEMSLPPVISMLIQSMYNIVDSIFVARLGEDVLTAVSLAYPLQNVALAVAVGFGVSINAVIARNMGAGRKEDTDIAAAHGVVLTALHCILFILLGIFFTKPFISMFTEDQNVLLWGCEYSRIVICISCGMMFHILIEKMFQSIGNMIMPMIMQGVGALVNIILDPIMIFGIFGFPALGVRGAAIATVAGQFTACIISVILFLRANSGINIRLKGFRFDKDVIKQLYSVAVPSAVMLSLPSVLVGALNSILSSISQTAVAVLGIYFKLQSFVYMPVNGVIQGMRPIVSYNYGAGNMRRMYDTVKSAVFISAAIMAVGTVVFIIFPDIILDLFSANGPMLEMGTEALRIIGLGFIVSTFSVVFSGVFEALNRGAESLIVSLVRQFAVTIPLSLLLVKIWGVTGVWISFPVSELLSAFCALLIYRLFVSKMKNQIDIN